MAAYAYTAINAEGLELSGEVQAPTAEAAREQLRVQGLLAELLQELPADAERSGGRADTVARRARGFMKTREAAVAAGVLAAVRDDDRRGPERRHLAQILEEQTDRRATSPP